MSERYALFGGLFYYPDGGASDFIRWCDSVEAAKAEAQSHRRCEWFEIATHDMDALLIGERMAPELIQWTCKHRTAVEITECGMTRRRYRCLSCGKEWNGELIDGTARSG